MTPDEIKAMSVRFNDVGIEGLADYLHVSGRDVERAMNEADQEKIRKADNNYLTLKAALLSRFAALEKVAGYVVHKHEDCHKMVAVNYRDELVEQGCICGLDSAMRDAGMGK